MEQVLFVLQGGKISQWNRSRGKLEAVKSHGLLQVPYSSKTAKAYWDAWKEDNQVVDGDVYDALFLSGGPNDFGKLPKWICAGAKDKKSTWTFEQLSLLANEEAFKSTGLCLVQGKVKRLVGTDTADKAVVLQMKSSLAFTLPKETPTPVAKPPPDKPAPKTEAKESPPSAQGGLAADGDGKSVEPGKANAMSLLERKHEKERKAAEAAAQEAKEKKLRELAVHPLVKGGCGQDVRDAYFKGLAFAAIADDDKVGADERALLDAIGASLGMSPGEIAKAVEGVSALDDEGKLALVEKCVTELKGNEAGVKLFCAHFVQIWTSHEYKEKDLSEYLGLFAEWTGVPFERGKRNAILKVVAGGDGLDECLYGLAEWMGDEALLYFVVGRLGDVSGEIAKVRRRKADEAAREKANSQIDAAMDEAARVYGDRASVSSDAWGGIAKLVKGIDGDKIDWSAKISPLLKNGISSFFGYHSCRSNVCRSNVWRLIALLGVEYKSLGTITDELDWLLRSSNIDRPSWPDRLNGLVEEHLADRVQRRPSP